MVAVKRENPEKARMEEERRVSYRGRRICLGAPMCFQMVPHTQKGLLSTHTRHGGEITTQENVAMCPRFGFGGKRKRCHVPKIRCFPYPSATPTPTLPLHHDTMHTYTFHETHHATTMLLHHGSPHHTPSKQNQHPSLHRTKLHLT